MAPNAFQPFILNPSKMSWNDRLRHARNFRLTVKKSMGDVLTNMQLLQLNKDADPVFVGIGGQEPQTLISAPLPRKRAPEDPLAEVLVKPLFSNTQDEQQATPSAEMQLFYERMRSHIVSGITGISVHKEPGCILLASCNKIRLLRNGEMSPLAEWFDGAIMNPALCPVDPTLTAFCANGQLYIDRNNSLFYSTPPLGCHTSGVASFIAQEELERFEGFWWHPRLPLLLYEEVDESDVEHLSFDVPGHKSGEPMRYPLTGTLNPISRLCLLELNLATGSSEIRNPNYNLSDIFPWYEYLVRAGWADEDYVYATIMNRVQTRLAIILLHRKAFEDSDLTLDEIRSRYIFVIYEEESNVWINFNNLLHFLPSRPDSEVQFLYGSEKNNNCHIYLRSCTLQPGALHNCIQTAQDIPITSGDWAVAKETPLCVDEERGHVYFLANNESRLHTTLCVTSYRMHSAVRSLTPSDLCYRSERGQFNMYVNPNIGFVAWVSAINLPPQCRYIRLVQSGPPCPQSPLPKTVFEATLRVSSNNAVATTTENRENLRSSSLLSSFRYEICEYVSQESGMTHYAAVFLPAVTSRTSDGYPVIHHVYAGPSVQLVRNCWPTVAQFLKFITLGYAVVIVDGRGSANRGINFEAPIKNHLGAIEAADQLEGLQQCAKRCNGLLDLNRVAVTGWSYGGYMALQMFVQYPENYRACCAGGAVTDWNLYDTCYTERYMSLPTENGEGYKTSGIASIINKFPDEEGRLLIVHGLIDENVHFKHTEALINGLIAAGKPFEQLIFPSERHGLRQGATVEFFHARMFSFFANALMEGRYIPMR